MNIVFYKHLGLPGNGFEAMFVCWPRCAILFLRWSLWFVSSCVRGPLKISMALDADRHIFPKHIPHSRLYIYMGEIEDPNRNDVAPGNTNSILRTHIL